MTVNKITLLGNLGNDPEIRYMPDGTAIAQLSVATSNRWKNKQGEQKEKTEWHRVKFFGKQAEIIGQYAKKGTMMYIEGRMEYGQYEKDGHKVYTSDVRGQVFQFVGSSSEGSSDDYKAPAQQSYEQGKQEDQDFDDDIPF